MDDLDKLLGWTERLDRFTQFDALMRLQLFVPHGWIPMTDQVNDTDLPPLTAMLRLVAQNCDTPSRREGLRFTLATWFDIVFVEGSTSSFSSMSENVRMASHSAPISPEQHASMMSMLVMSGAIKDNTWSKAVKSWKEFRHAERK